MSRGRTFFWSQLSAAIEPVAGGHRGLADAPIRGRFWRVGWRRPLARRSMSKAVAVSGHQHNGRPASREVCAVAAPIPLEAPVINAQVPLILIGLR